MEDSESRHVPPSRGDLPWLLDAMTAMLRCQNVRDLLDIAYDAIRNGLGYDRVGLLLVDPARDALVAYVGTDEEGRRWYPEERLFPLGGNSFSVRLLLDPRMQIDGPGFVYLSDVTRATPPEQMHYLDGCPSQNLVAALRTRDEVIGLLSVDNLVSGRPIVVADAPPLVAFATALATAVENVTLLEQQSVRIGTLSRDVQRGASESRWLREVSRRIGAAHTLDELADALYDGVRDGLKYDRVGLHVFDHPSAQCVELRGTDAAGRKIARSGRVTSIAPGSAIWDSPNNAAILRGADFYYTPDIVQETPEGQRYMLDGEPQENLTVALRSGERLVGMISVDNLLSGRPIPPGAVRPLQALASQAAIAVEKARLQEREQIERTRLHVLVESARAISSTLDRGQILQELAGRMAAALGATVVSFSQYDQESRQYTSLAFYASSGRGVLPVAAHSPKLAEVLSSGRIYYGHLEDFSLEDADRESLRRRGHAVELLVPVLVRGEAAGVLEAHWDRPIVLDADTVSWCRAIAEQAGAALTNAALYAAVAERAERDGLTGLLNHVSGLERLDASIALGQPFSLFLIDVDHFKLFNDSYGHRTGDAVLMQIASTLRTMCREGDVAARYGGDEFVLILRDIDDTQAICDRLSQAVRTDPFVDQDGTRLPLSISIGAVSYPVDAVTRRDLIDLADQGMYATKRGTAIRATSSPPSEESPLDLLEGLVRAIDIRDHYSYRHAQEVTRLSLLLADAVRLPPDQRRALEIAGLVHDVGKIAVPDRILRKPGALNEEEHALLRRHISYGAAIVRGMLDDDGVVEAVGAHHEHWDGTGYPNRLSGPAIPLLARILHLTDSVAALLADRPYRPRLTWARIQPLLRVGAGTQFDPHLVHVLIEAIERTEGAHSWQAS